MTASLLQQQAADSVNPKALKRLGPTADSELARIEALPVRVWTDEVMRATANGMTEILRTRIGRQRLFPLQAVALAEISEVGGLIGAIPVGGGKSLVSMLAPRMRGHHRGLLIVPAKLRDKTIGELKTYGKHWQIAQLEIQSYEALSRVKQANYIQSIRPPIIICDEAHRLANRKTAAWRRIVRYLEEHPQTELVILSGTITRRSVRDYYHLMRYALREGSPLPRTAHIVEAWAEVLDAEADGPIGALAKWGGSRDAIRKAFHARVSQTPGVIYTSDRLGVSLRIDQWEPEKCPVIDRALADLDRTWALPDGQEIADGLQLYRHALTLSLGFWYRWVIPPPLLWQEARTTWARYVRSVLGRHGDTEQEVALRIVNGKAPDGELIYREWKKIEPSFLPEIEPVWISDSTIHSALAWAHEAPGIVWYDFRAFAERLDKLAQGIQIFGPEGRTRTGTPIESCSGQESVFASTRSSGEGRNLQMFSRALVLTPPTTIPWEQLLGRLHRTGQTADEVTFEVLLRSNPAKAAWRRALAQAAYIEQTTGQTQRIQYADCTIST